MAFEDLTEQQIEFITKLIELLATGEYQQRLYLLSGKLLGQKKGQSSLVPFDLPYLSTDIATLREEDYIVVVGDKDFPQVALKAKAYQQYKLSKQPETNDAVPVTKGDVIQDADLAALGPSLERFKKDHPQPERCGFVMMRYAGTPQHKVIVEVVREVCSAHGLKALRADDKSYANELLPNVRTYMHGCGFGVAIIERLITDDFNPNVSLEMGYMMALRKPVCLLKDSTLPFLQTDLVGTLYEKFDTQNPADSIPPVLKKWLADRSLVPPTLIERFFL